MNARKVTAASLLAAGVAAAILGSACGGKPAKDPKSAATIRSTTLQHEACEGGKVEALDANGDGKPDVQKFSDGKSGAEKCRSTDLNHDGKADLYEFFDANGQVRRRELAFDDTGAIMAVEIFENGKRVRRELDTTGQRKIDTWDVFDPATGKLVSRERDASGDGVIDQWWTWDGDKVTIAVDRNGDGRPDPEATITVQGSQATYGVTGGMVAGGGDAGAGDGGAPSSDAGAPATIAPPAPASTDALADPSKTKGAAAAKKTSAADGGAPASTDGADGGAGAGATKKGSKGK